MNDDAPVDPIRNVERPVCTECSEVVGGDCLGLASALEHEELGEDGDALEVYREGPEDLEQVEPALAVVGEEGEHAARPEQVLEPERVDARVVCWPVRVRTKLGAHTTTHR